LEYASQLLQSKLYNVNEMNEKAVFRMWNISADYLKTNLVIPLKFIKAFPRKFIKIKEL